MSASDSVLVLGATGMLGHCVVDALESREIQVRALTGSRFRTGRDLQDAVTALAPGAVVNCMGYKGSDRSAHYLVNGLLPRALADWAHQHAKLCIGISTNVVFSPHEERRWLPFEMPAPDTDYEVAKYLGEDPRAYVLRVSFIGRSPRKDGFFEAALEGRPYWDRRWNGVTTLVLARRIVAILEAGTHARTAIEHVHSSSPVWMSDVVRSMNSSSVPLGRRDDSRLLGGGIEVPPLEDQVDELLRTAVTWS